MSDAASDAYYEARASGREYNLYREMIGREGPRRIRALDALIKFLKRKNSATRKAFYEACADLHQFDPAEKLEFLEAQSESVWAGLLHLVQHDNERFLSLKRFSPFRGKDVSCIYKAGTTRGHSEKVLVVGISFEGKVYTRDVPCEPFFNPAKEYLDRKWRYYEGARPW